MIYFVRITRYFFFNLSSTCVCIAIFCCVCESILVTYRKKVDSFSALAISSLCVIQYEQYSFRFLLEARAVISPFLTVSHGICVYCICITLKHINIVFYLLFTLETRFRRHYARNNNNNTMQILFSLLIAL